MEQSKGGGFPIGYIAAKGFDQYKHVTVFVIHQSGKMFDVGIYAIPYEQKEQAAKPVL